MHPLRAPVPLPLGNSISPHARLRRLPGASSGVVPARGVVIREGEVPQALFVVEHGALALRCAGARVRGATLAILGPGEAFGFEALGRTGGPGPMLLPEARALVPGRILAIPLNSLLAASERDPQMVEWLLEAAAARLDALGRRLLRSLTLPVAEHVHIVLCDLARTFGRQAPDGLRIELPLSQEGIAALVGATRESVNRALRSLDALGLVRRSGRRYLVRTGPEAHSGDATSANLRSP